MDKNIGILQDKVCLITGTSRGIGRATAECFALEGAVVYANARTNGCLTEWAESINAQNRGTIIPIYFDLTDTEAIRKAILQIKKDVNRLDILVNNAGIVSNEMLGMISMDKTREMFEVNVFGLLNLTQLAATRFMMKQKSGNIINISSAVGVHGSKGQIAYSASKGAVVALTKSMAKELAPYHIRVNALAPGMIQTERLQKTIKDVYKEKIPPIAMGRLGSPQEIAEGCLYFASESSSYITGQILVIGGGLTL